MVLSTWSQELSAFSLAMDLFCCFLGFSSTRRSCLCFRKGTLHTPCFSVPVKTCSLQQVLVVPSFSSVPTYGHWDAPFKTYKLVVRSDGDLLRLEHQLLWNGCRIWSQTSSEDYKMKKTFLINLFEIFQIGNFEILYHIRLYYIYLT